MQTGLALLAGQSPAVAKLLSEAAASFAVKPGDSQALAALERLLSRQHYRLDHWRLAATRANYRRFFDIGQLIGVRMERPAVFDRTHGLIGRLIAEGKLDGLRLDHVDGLKDPAAYCRRLRRFVERQRRSGGQRGRAGEFYIVVEKILGAGEKLRADWPVQGTTGYEFITLLEGIFTDPAGARPLQRICESLAGKRLRFDAILAEAKGQVIDSSFVADLDRLAVQFQRLAPRFTTDELRGALRRIAICFPLYRSYVSRKGAGPEDRRLIDKAVAEALGGVRGRGRAVYSFLRRGLKGEGDAGPWPMPPCASSNSRHRSWPRVSRIRASIAIPGCSPSMRSAGRRRNSACRRRKPIALWPSAGPIGRPPCWRRRPTTPSAGRIAGRG